MKNTYLLLLSLFSISVFAQPTVTSAWVPGAGLSYRTAYFNVQTLNEGSAGANVTWNFAGLDTSDTHGSRYITPASGLSGGLFPGATNCVMFTDSSDYEYYELSGSVYQIIGAVSPPSSSDYTLTYSDPADIMHFPVTYNSTFNDNAHYKQMMSGANPETVEARSSAVTTVDGYGTLITKAGTFNNVLRLHMAQRELDSTYSTHSTDSFITDGYIWISPTVPGVILATMNHFRFGGSTQDDGYYSQVTATGVATLESVGISSWSVLPQPSRGSSSVIIYSAVNAHTSIFIHDMMGRLVSEKIVDVTPGSNDVKLDVSSFADGLYTVSLTSDGVTASQKLVVRSQ